MKQFLHRKATLSKVLLVIRDTAHSTQASLSESWTNGELLLAESWEWRAAIGRAPGDSLRFSSAGLAWKYHEQRQQPDQPTQPSHQDLNQRSWK